LVIEIVAWIVEEAGSCTVPTGTMLPGPVADQEVAAWTLEQEKAEVLGTHRRLELHDIGRADQALEHLPRELCLGRMVDRRWVVPVEGELAPCSVSLANPFGDLPHTPLDQIEQLERERPNCTLQLAAVGQNIGRLSSMDHRDRDDGCIDGSPVARDDGLQSLHDLTRD